MTKEDISFSKIQKLYGEKWWPFHTDPFKINLTGIRTDNIVPDQINDWMTLAYYDDKNTPILKIWPCTTDPTLFYLKNPMSFEGTAAMKPGFYKDMWVVGLFRDLYKALIQNAPCTVIRNYMRKEDLSFIEWPHEEEMGIFAICLHYFLTVGKASAGCQTLRKEDFIELMLYVYIQIQKTKKQTFSYGLLEEKDFAA